MLELFQLSDGVHLCLAERQDHVRCSQDEGDHHANTLGENCCFLPLVCALDLLDGGAITGASDVSRDLFKCSRYSDRRGLEDDA